MKKRRHLHLPFSIRVVVLTCLLSLLVNCLALAKSYTQEVLEKKITLSINKQKVRDILNKLESESGIKFSYSAKLIDANKAISFTCSNMKLKEVLETFFKPAGIGYKEVGGQIVLFDLPATTEATTLQAALYAAQQITGTVINEKQEPLAGVSVTIEGTRIGTTTDEHGRFVLKTTTQSLPATIRVSIIGYAETSAVVNDETPLTIVLKENASKLNEIIVVGYGTQKKVNLTGAVSTVSGAEMTRRPITNPINMLQGQIPGLSVVQGTGQPGGESNSIRIRGQGTYSGAGSDPLVLIDGVPGSLSVLNPADIETVSVLKDASAASIYGARAANGVILVTTKSGKDGVARLSYNINVGRYTPTKMLDIITSSPDYMKLFNEAKTNSGLPVNQMYTDDMIKAYTNPADKIAYPSFNWLDYAFSPAWVTNQNLSLSGGAKGTTYNISLAYVNQPGTMRGFKYERYNVRANLKSRLKDWITIGANFAADRGNRQQTVLGQEDAFLSYYSQAPTYMPMLPDGQHYSYSAYSFESRNKNMAGLIDNNMFEKAVTTDFTPQLWTDIKIAKGLSWYTKGSATFTDVGTKGWTTPLPVYDYHTGNLVTTLSITSGNGPGLTVSDAKTFYANVFSYLKYDKRFGENHNFSAQAGFSEEYNKYESLSGYRQYFSAPLQELAAGSPTNQSTGGTSWQWGLRSFFGRINYDYKGRYLAEANLRYDGTSRMAQDSRWGVFPSFSAGWRISEENFIKNNKSFEWLNNLKLRGSYGILGNQNISDANNQPYPYQAILNFTGNYPFDNAALSTGVAQNAMPNNKIKWESTSIFNIGLDLTIFKGLSITYEWYRKYTYDILRQAQVTAPVGMSAPFINSGAMLNTGNELTVQYQHTVNKGVVRGLNYSATAYFTQYKNAAKNFGSTEYDGNGYYIRQNGLPYNSYYVLQCAGVFQNAQEILKSPSQYQDKLVPGDLRYIDVNNSGTINDSDKVVVPGRFPKFEYSLNLSASWKGFDLSVFFQGVNGRKIFVTDWGYEAFIQGAPPTTDWYGRWHGEGTSDWMPRITYNKAGNSQNLRPSTWFLQDASYLRLKNITVGYTLPTKLISRIKCERMRFYFSADNLITFTKFTGLDPERAGDGRFTQYPQNKIISFGANIDF